MSYFPEPDSHIRDKVKVVLGLSGYTVKKELEHAVGIDTSDLAAKKKFLALKAEVHKIDINEPESVLTSWKNFKTKIDDWNFGKLKTFSVDLKKIKKCIRQWICRKYKIQHTKKINNLEKKIPDAATLIHINQCNTDKKH